MGDGEKARLKMKNSMKGKVWLLFLIIINGIFGTLNLGYWLIEGSLLSLISGCVSVFAISCSLLRFLIELKEESLEVTK